MQMQHLCLQYAYFTGLLTMKNVREAFEEARLIDKETHTFRLYSSVKHVYSIFE